MAREVFKIVDLVVTFQEEDRLDVYLVFELQDAKVKTSVRQSSLICICSNSTKPPTRHPPRQVELRMRPDRHSSSVQVFENAGSQAGVRFTDKLMLPKSDWGPGAPPGADELLVRHRASVCESVPNDRAGCTPH